MEKVKLLLVLLSIFSVGCSVSAQSYPITTTIIFSGDEFNSFDIDDNYIAFIGGNQYKDIFPGYFSGDYYGVWIYNINTKELNLITNPHDSSTESAVSLDNNKVYWMETRVYDTQIFSYDLSTKTEEVTKLNVIKYIESYDNKNKKNWSNLVVWHQCENDACYNEELWFEV